MQDLEPLYRSIRPIALCVYRHEGRILVSDEHDPVSGERFHRPLGGGIEYGETSEEAMVREAQEEIGAAIRDLKLLAVLENHFVWAGKFGHEVVFLYDASFEDPSFYERDLIEGDEAGTPIRAVWVDPTDLGGIPLYPSGLAEVLARET